MDNQCGWIALAGESVPRATLRGVQRADWLVIGAGITGLCAAHALAERHPQARIVILERQRAAQGASARNSGFVVAHELPGTDERLDTPGFAGYQFDSAIGLAASAELRSLVARHAIDCELHEAGYHFAVHDPATLAQAQARLDTLRATGAAVQWQEGEALARRLGTDHYQAAIYCAGGNALLQPAKYVKGLLDALPANVSLYECSPVEALQRLGGGRLRASGPHGSVEASRVLLCLNAFLPRVGVRHSATFALELSASLTRPLTDAEYQSIGSVEPWGVLSAARLGATMRLTPDRRILIRNTAEYRLRDLTPGQLQTRRRHHLQGLRRRFPWLGEQDIACSWSGHLSASRSGQPYFAEVESGLFAVAGCNGSGVARGSLWGRLLAELASGDNSALSQQVLQRARPGWLPPRPLFDIGAALRLRFEALRAGREA